MTIREHSEPTGPSQEDVDRLHWWHSIEFPNGVISRGGKCVEMLESEAEFVFKYPVDGNSVLDLGAWNGYFTAKACRLGATDILAVDQPTWNHPGPANGFAGFQLVQKYLAPTARALNCDVNDLRVEVIGQFDVVLFLGVLYHLKNPLFVLENLGQIARKRIVIETHLDALNEERPAAIFYPGDECRNDGSNWWGVNPACLRAMLEVAGFKNVEVIPYPGRPDRCFAHAWKA
jgi:tRNA (mo5U34)-methyltransferase